MAIAGRRMRSGILLTIIILAVFFLLPGPAEGHPPCACCIKDRVLQLRQPPLEGPDVSDLQLRLAQLGYYFGPRHGVFDAATGKAVVNFQQARGLAAAGCVDVSTWQALGQDDTYKANSSESPSMPPPGNLKVIIDTDRLVLTIMVDGRVFRRYPVAIGKYNSPSPVGEWKIIDKAYERGGAFGTRWMGLNVPWGNYGIHGTNRPWSIGWPASAGCFRMYNEDVETIYPWLPVGTPVVVRGEYVPPDGILRPGEASPRIVTLQARLRELGFYSYGPTDGDYGLMTELAVRQFQIYHGLPPTGVADAVTLNALGFNVALPQP